VCSVLGYSEDGEWLLDDVGSVSDQEDEMEEGEGGEENKGGCDSGDIILSISNHK